MKKQLARIFATGVLNEGELVEGSSEKWTFLGKAVLTLAVVGILSLPSLTLASVITYSNRAAFDAQGTIAFNSNFSDFGPGFSFPDDPFTRGDVTYRSTNNLIWGSDTPYTTTEPLIGNNFWTPVLGDIATGSQYDMFGFDIGTYNTSQITISVFTNMDSYIYPSLTIANSAAGLLEFKGFITSSGEYFTGFSLVADNGVFNLPGITNVSLGNAGGAPVPEPASLLLLGSGMAGLLAWRRKQQR